MISALFLCAYWKINFRLRDRNKELEEVQDISEIRGREFNLLSLFANFFYAHKKKNNDILLIAFRLERHLAQESNIS